MTEQERILNYASEKFLKDGYAKTTMDEIAADLKVSKKTIYKYFKSKDGLFLAMTQALQMRIKGEMSNIIDSDSNSVEKLYGISQVIMRMGLKVTPRFINDVRIHKPEVWEKLDKFRQQMIFHNFNIIFTQGIKEGLIVDRPKDIAVSVMLGAIRSVITPEFLITHNYSLTEAGRIVFDMIFTGAFTENGTKVFKQLNQEKQK